ncbi:MAG: hypothetical protein ACR2PR_08705 [Pseudohongiellaceae bacterium]
MAEPTIIEGGINDSIPNTFWDIVGAPILDPSRYVKYFNDFFAYVAADWNLTGTPTVALNNSSVAGGVLDISTIATINTRAVVDLNSEPFEFAIGKRAWCAVRFALLDVATTEFEAGVKSNATNGIYFRVNNGGAANVLQLVILNGSGSRIVDLGTVNATSVFTAGWFYDGGDEVHAYFNDTLVTVETGISGFINTVQSTPRFDVENLTAAVRTASVDYFFACQDR